MKSNANKKLKNLDTIKKLLDGEHSRQTRRVAAVSDTESKLQKDIDEQWIDDNGVQYIQKDGYVLKEGKLKFLRDSISRPKNCPKETCVCTTPGQADKKMLAIHGMCLQCVSESETQMRIDGTYANYEKQMILQNVQRWLQDARKDASIIAEYMSSANVVLQDGSVEEWSGENKDSMKEKILAEFDQFETEFLEKLNKQK